MLTTAAMEVKIVAASHRWDIVGTPTVYFLHRAERRLRLGDMAPRRSRSMGTVVQVFEVLDPAGFEDLIDMLTFSRGLLCLPAVHCRTIVYLSHRSGGFAIVSDGNRVRAAVWVLLLPLPSLLADVCGAATFRGVWVYCDRASPIPIYWRRSRGHRRHISYGRCDPCHVCIF